jgi:hypothetical protein
MRKNGTLMTRIGLMNADFFNCLLVELFSCLEDAGSYYSETVTAAISYCLVLQLQLFSFCPFSLSLRRPLAKIAPSLSRFFLKSVLYF